MVGTLFALETELIWSDVSSAWLHAPSDLATPTRIVRMIANIDQWRDGAGGKRVGSGAMGRVGAVQPRAIYNYLYWVKHWRRAYNHSST